MFAPRSSSQIVLAFAFALSLGACHRDRCVPICEQRQKELGCQPRKTCKATCDELHDSASPCAAEFKGWEACIMKLPVDQWECDHAGQPAPKESTCPGERAKVELCLMKTPGTPPPPPPKN